MRRAPRRGRELSLAPRVTRHTRDRGTAGSKRHSCVEAQFPPTPILNRACRQLGSTAAARLWSSQRAFGSTLQSMAVRCFLWCLLFVVRRVCGIGFTDVTSSSGVAGDLAYIGVALGDLDGDNDLDLYLTRNDHNSVYRNDGGLAFMNVTNATHGPSKRGQTGVVMGDFDRDGDLDVYALATAGFNQMLRNDGGPSLLTDIVSEKMGTPEALPNATIEDQWAEGGGGFFQGSHESFKYVFQAAAGNKANLGDQGSSHQVRIRVLSMPEAGARYRTVKNDVGGNWVVSETRELALGENDIVIESAEEEHDRTVNVQFDAPSMVFDSFKHNGVELSIRRDLGVATIVDLIGSVFEAGSSNAKWPFICKLAEKSETGGRIGHELVMDVVALPPRGAQYSVARTVANGDWFFASPQDFNVGENTISIPSVAFDRSVNIRFTHGEVLLNAVVHNGNALYRGSSEVAELASTAAATMQFNLKGKAVAIGDLDGDGLEDLYLGITQSPNRLLLNQGNLNFVDFTSTSGIAGSSIGRTQNVLFGDLDSDGDLDIYTVDHRASENRLYRNDGALSFEDVTVSRQIDDHLTSMKGRGALFADFDNDGDLDLFVTTVEISHGNRMFRNDGGLRFVDVSAAFGGVLRANNGKGCAAGDFDHDGDIDLFFVAPDDAGGRVMLRNDGNFSFTDVSSTSGFIDGNTVIEDHRTTVVGDLDSDGDLDLLVLGEGGFRMYRNEAPPSEDWIMVRALDSAGLRTLHGAEVRLVLPGSEGFVGMRHIDCGSFQTQSPYDVHFGLGAAEAERFDVQVRPMGSAEWFTETGLARGQTHEFCVAWPSSAGRCATRSWIPGSQEAIFPTASPTSAPSAPTLDSSTPSPTLAGDDGYSDPTIIVVVVVVVVLLLSALCCCLRNSKSEVSPKQSGAISALSGMIPLPNSNAKAENIRLKRELSEMQHVTKKDMAKLQSALEVQKKKFAHVQADLAKANEVVKAVMQEGGTIWDSVLEIHFMDLLEMETIGKGSFGTPAPVALSVVEFFS